MPNSSKNRLPVTGRTLVLLPAALLALALGAGSVSHAQSPDKGGEASPPSAGTGAAATQPAARPVSLLRPLSEQWPEQIEASGNIMPWQETRIGTEIGGLRLLSVLVNAGDVVKKGQVLARLNPASVEIELETANAQLSEAEAALAQAEATLARGQRLAPSGGVSQQELTLYQTQKHTAEARVNAGRAQVKTQQLKLDAATLLAPDDGLISSRSAVEGSIVPAGSELFRLIRHGRLEWRAEVKGETLLRLSAGQEAIVKSPLGPEIKGRVRQVSPTIDVATRNGLVYVDLPLDANLKAGLRASGLLTIGKSKALVLPATALQCRDAGCRVFSVNADNRLEAIEVTTGRRRNERVEITTGLSEQARVVAKDVGQLKAGDLVEVRSGAGA
ncbi:efflux RND transporter periplasmic adaptor subunit [Rhodocyclus tenuis]|uniref:RND family efflux transporter MFP subunit n=1 Tax=Rhodocyclus tenuis TaxID=1066 RepID=A0A840G9Q8_RHOTE|nr:efflux RND transporter periplasmic adaptor subunit [Rhodocyclus tenuis]MBB4248576.1 RND family efflux transporter MFP subunit [Rhodocyclus tenuis]